MRKIIPLIFVLLLFLTVVNLLEFYFEQFSTIVPATVQFLLLLLLLRYRKRFTLRGTSGSLHLQEIEPS